MSDFELLSSVSGEGSLETPEVAIKKFLASLGITGNGRNFPDGVNADNVALAMLFGTGDQPSLFPLDFPPVIGDASTLEPPEGLDRWGETQKDRIYNNFPYYFPEERLDLGKFIKGFPRETDLFEKTLNPVTIDTTALMDVLGARIDFGRLLDFFTTD